MSQGDPEHYGDYCRSERAPIRAQKNSEGECESKGPCPGCAAGRSPTFQCEEGEYDAEQAQTLGERYGGVVGGEGAERREPEGRHLRARAHQSAGEFTEQQAAEEIDRGLNADDRNVVR